VVRGTGRRSGAATVLTPPPWALGALAQARRRMVAFRSTPLGRRTARRRVVALVLAAAVGLTVLHLVGTAQAAVRRWGPTTPVLVATVALPAGAELGPATVRTEPWPTRLVPEGALGAADGRRTARPVAAGAPITATDLAGAAQGAVVARMPAGTVGVTLARGAAPAPVRAGDRVDVLGVAAEGRSLGAERVAVRGTVVAADRVAVTVAVRRAEADGVAAVAAAGTAVLVLVP